MPRRQQGACWPLPWLTEAHPRLPACCPQPGHRVRQQQEEVPLPGGRRVLRAERRLRCVKNCGNDKDVVCDLYGVPVKEVSG